MSLHQEHCLKVYLYLRTHGPATARDIAFAVYGEGRTRTRERNAVHAALIRLEEDGRLEKRISAAYRVGTNTPHLWGIKAR